MFAWFFVLYLSKNQLTASTRCHTSKSKGSESLSAVAVPQTTAGGICDTPADSLVGRREDTLPHSASAIFEKFSQTWSIVVDNSEILRKDSNGTEMMQVTPMLRTLVSFP